MLSLNNFISKPINESKSSLKLSKDEIETLYDMIDEITNNKIFKTKFYKYEESKNNIYDSYNRLTPGSKYLISFRSNPLADDKRISATPGNPTKVDKVNNGFCVIGIADNDTDLHLYGKKEFDNNAVLTIAETERAKEGNGWYGRRRENVKSLLLFVKGIKNYKVFANESQYSTRKFYYRASNKAFDNIVNLDCGDKIDLIYDLNHIPEKTKEILDEIEKEAEVERKREERRKYWEMVTNEYTSFGTANGWVETPKELKEIKDKGDADWVCYREDLGYRRYVSDKYKCYYYVDSSD
jgi:hypothetical protein